MKTLMLLILLAFSIYCYYSSPAPTAKVGDTIAQPAQNPVVVREIIVVPAPSYQERWKTGPNAYTDLKTGPNAQVNFEPFAPNEQAHWNDTPRYTVTSGNRLPRR